MRGDRRISSIGASGERLELQRPDVPDPTQSLRLFNGDAMTAATNATLPLASVQAANNLRRSLGQTLAALPGSLDARWVRLAVGSAGPARSFRVVVAPLSNP